MLQSDFRVPKIKIKCLAPTTVPLVPNAGSGPRRSRRGPVNKERARSGESKTASKASTRDSKSASQRGGERSRSGAEGPTKDQLYEEAKKRNIEGRSSMSKKELKDALGR